MAVGRMLNRTVGLDQELNSVSVEAQLLFLMSIPHLDRDGLIIGEALPHLGTVLPLRPDFFPRYEQLIAELIDCEIVTRYQTKKGRVLFFPGFRKNQTFSYTREGASIFDPPPGYIRTPSGIEPDKHATESVVTQELLPTDSGVTPDHYTLKISKDKISKDQDKASDGDGKEIKYSDSFEEFWKVYPKKIGKGAAYKSWKIIKPSDVLKEKIINAVKMQCNSIQWQKEGGQYIPNPSTWLNQERWNDELKYNNVGSKYAGLGRDL